MADIKNSTGVNKDSDMSQPSRNRFALKSPNEALQPVATPEPPPRRRRKGGFLSKISGIFTFLVVLGFVGGGVAYYVSNQTTMPGPLALDKVVMIPKNSSGDDIVDQLARENIIAHPGLMSAYLMVKRPKLRAGEYLFKKQVSMADAIETLVSGKAIIHKVTVPEGLTSEQIVERLIENDILSGEIAETPREGTLLPDTYTFERGFTREQMLKSMRNAQEKLVKDIWARRSPDVPLRSQSDLVILASIVEKETGKADERPHVAGVFVNRLNRDMRLQTDPTVVYGIAGGKGSLGRGLTRSELDTPTPFNTYLIKGLPPGPIANPGRAALEAAGNPAKTRDIFFVADGKGGHSFAETNEQHVRNVARWRQIEREQKEIPVVTPSPDVSPGLGFAPCGQGATPDTGLKLPGSMKQPQFAPRSFLAVPQKQQVSEVNSLIRKTVFDGMPLPKIEKPMVTAKLAHDFSGLESANSSQPLSSSSTGFIDQEPAVGQVESYPVPAYRRTGSGNGANMQSAAEVQDSQPQEMALSYQPEPKPMRSRAFDAVAGTAKDPLKNTTYDLNSPKTIPNLR